MKRSDKRPVKSEFLVSVDRAIRRAAKEARRMAKMHGTKVWIMKDGKIVGLDP